MSAPVSAAQAEPAESLEDLERFRQRARAFIRENLRNVGAISVSLRRGDDESELAGVARDREVQRLLFDGGLAGICVPRAYGGLIQEQRRLYRLYDEARRQWRKPS